MKRINFTDRKKQHEIIDNANAQELLYEEVHDNGSKPNKESIELEENISYAM